MDSYGTRERRRPSLRSRTPTGVASLVVLKAFMSAAKPKPGVVELVLMSAADSTIQAEATERKRRTTDVERAAAASLTNENNDKSDDSQGLRDDLACLDRRDQDGEPSQCFYCAIAEYD
jgi:hypothetical protein